MMKKHLFSLVLAALLLVAFVSVAAAQAACTLSELRAQVAAMGGRWMGTYEAMGRSVPVNAPILLPQADAFPVLTLTRLQPDEAVFNDVTSRGEHIERLRYVITPEGGDAETRPGMSDIYECTYFNFYERSLGHDDFSYPYVYGVSVTQGEYSKKGHVGDKYYKGQDVGYTVYDYDPSRSYIEDNPLTPDDALAKMREIIAAYYPGVQIEIGHDSMIAISRQYEANSHTGEITGGPREDSYEGYYKLSPNQLFFGIPVYRAVNEYELNRFGHSWTYGTSTGSSDKKIEDGIYEKVHRNEPDLYLMYRGDKALNTLIHLSAIRSVEAADVPLAPLSDVIASVEALIASGNIREVRGLRLGYVLYPDKDTKDYLWAVPRWLVDCVYAEKPGAEIDWNAESEWDNYKEMLVDAQTAEAYNFLEITREQFTTPRFLTWEGAR